MIRPQMRPAKWSDMQWMRPVWWRMWNQIRIESLVTGQPYVLITYMQITQLRRYVIISNYWNQRTNLYQPPSHPHHNHPSTHTHTQDTQLDLQLIPYNQVWTMEQSIKMVASSFPCAYGGEKPSRIRVNLFRYPTKRLCIRKAITHFRACYLGGLETNMLQLSNFMDLVSTSSYVRCHCIWTLLKHYWSISKLLVIASSTIKGIRGRALIFLYCILKIKIPHLI